MVLDSRGNYFVDDTEDVIHLDSHLFLDAIVMGLLIIIKFSTLTYYYHNFCS